MKVEIGFVRDWGDVSFGPLTERLKLVVTAETETEGTLVRMFKRRMGMKDFSDDGVLGQMVIEEPPDPVNAALEASGIKSHEDILPDAGAR